MEVKLLKMVIKREARIKYTKRTRAVENTY